MAFFKFRQRGQPQSQPETRGRGKAPAAAAEPQETIDSMRRRARHRLLGAAVLVLVAVVGFPILFDTQPRPVVVDAPITIPDKDQAPPLQPRPAPDSVSAGASLDESEQLVATPAPRTPAAPEARPEADTRAADEAARAQREQEAQARREQETEARREREAQARREQDAQARQDAQAKREQEAQQAKRGQEAQAKREQEARAKREADERARREEAARAKALLEGRGTAAATAAADSGRFIVQIGAFADAGAAREVRQRAERAGLKTYTQVVDTAQGKRTRVRVGPYSSRTEAEQAAAALKKAGLSGSILSL